ncbi:tetratricopeptide repeat protein [Novosphingobium sp. KCTC 2891]|uniref:tetratricopeptide repeat protein n=1 Tax=Novosphingobium sp. KCTC 2891 TaxID=2989730 RepID=UPI002223B95E|nr:tetratricopeptide repeat protein [Novosphingobium sp. KCTC 2891]MCW1382811.1 tetratricopeptide repeat protein [Novosphingobium sp. KCTC 2891]
MTWVLILLIALAAFGVLAFVLKMPRAGWEITGAALLFGIAGYALQGHPGYAGAPKQAVENEKAADAALLKQRQEMGESFGKGASWLTLADGLSRQGQFGAAADVLKTAVEKNPDDADLWVAFGNALVGHSDGLITPAAQFAFQKAATIAPEHPGPPFFMGLALAQSGRLADARAIWAELLKRSPADAPYRADLESRLARIDSMLAAAGQAAPDAAPAPAADAAPAAPAGKAP